MPKGHLKEEILQDRDFCLKMLGAFTVLLCDAISKGDVEKMEMFHTFVYEWVSDTEITKELDPYILIAYQRVKGAMAKLGKEDFFADWEKEAKEEFGTAH